MNQIDTDRKVINLMLRHSDVVAELHDQGISPAFFDIKYKPLVQAIFKVHAESQGKRTLTDEHYRSLLIDQGCKGDITVAMQVYHDCLYGLPPSNSKDDLDLLVRELRNIYVHRESTTAMHSLNQRVRNNSDYLTATRQFVDDLTSVVNFADRSKVSPLTKPFTTAEILAMKTNDQNWIWRGILLRGCMTLFAGYPKAGKSTFLSTLLSALDNGDEFIEPTSRAKVLYFTEEPLEILQMRFEADDITHLENVDWKLKEGTYSVEQFKAFASSFSPEKYDLVVVDTVTNWFDIKNESDNSFVAGILNGLKDFFGSRYRNTALLLIHHSGKQGRDDPRNDLELIRGASAWVQVPDMVCTFGRVDNRDLLNRRRKMNFLGRTTPRSTYIEVELPADAARYEIVDLGMPVEHYGTADGVVDVVTVQPSTLKEIVAAMSGCSRTTVQRLVSECVKDGRIHKSGSGRKNDPFLYSAGHCMGDWITSIAEYQSLEF